MVDIDADTLKLKRTSARLLGAGIIFITVAIVCISFIFSPVKIVNESTTIDGSTHQEISSSPAISFEGGLLLSESWKKYPDYNIGLGIAALVSFGGFIYCVIMVENTLKDEVPQKTEL